MFLLLPLVSCCLASVLLLRRGEVSKEVSIPVLPQILEGPELIYLQRPGELYCSDVRKQKFCLNISGTCLYESHSNKAYMTVEGPMILVQSAVKQVSVTAFSNLSSLLWEWMKCSSRYLSRRLLVNGYSSSPCLIMVLSRMSMRLRKIFTHSLQPISSFRRYALLCTFMGMNTLCL